MLLENEHNKSAVWYFILFKKKKLFDYKPVILRIVFVWKSNGYQRSYVNKLLRIIIHLLK